MTDLHALLEDVQAGTIGRRAFLIRSMALGLSFATASELFTACIPALIVFIFIRA